MKKKGFTLIELVVVMAIIAVLAVLIIGAIIVARNTAKETTHRANAKSIQTGIEALYARQKNYSGIVNGTFVQTAGAPVNVTLQTSGACTDATYNGGGTVTTSTTSGQPAYTINVANASCNGTNSGDQILGPVN